MKLAYKPVQIVHFGDMQDIDTQQIRQAVDVIKDGATYTITHYKEALNFGSGLVLLTNAPYLVKNMYSKMGPLSEKILNLKQRVIGIGFGAKYLVQLFGGTLGTVGTLATETEYVQLLPQTEDTNITREVNLFISNFSFARKEKEPIYGMGAQPRMIREQVTQRTRGFPLTLRSL